MRVAIFIDGKNFYTGWRDATGCARIDFNHMAKWLVGKVDGTDLFAVNYYTGVESDELALDDTRGKLQGFLSILRQQPGFFVHTFPRKQSTTTCVHCNGSMRYTKEKEVDTSVVADMVSLAHQDSFDVAILLSGDTDFLPAVRALNRLGKKVYLASWNGIGVSQQLRNQVFDHINLVGGINNFMRESETFVAGLESDETIEVTGSGPEAFLMELEKAEIKFAGGYVGLGYFLNKWLSEVLTSLPDQRRDILDGLIKDGRVEVYQNETDRKDSLRIT